MTTMSAHRGLNIVLIAIIVVVLLGIGIGVVIFSHKPQPASPQLNQPSNSVASKVSPTLSTAPGNLTEKWTGTWTNSLGEHGNDTLEIARDEAGNIKGVWSGTINLTGQWLDKTNIKLNSRTSTRDYQVKGTIQGDTLILNYVATRLNTSGTYTGEEKLTRISP